MNKLTIKDLKEQKLLLLECLAGSKAYGLSIPSSDTDIKGVYILPKEHYYSLNYTDQINDKKNDVVYYELNKFLGMLSKSNPGTIELLHTRSSETIFKHPLMDLIQPEWYLTQVCAYSFGNYGISQIKKAYGLNKKVLNPMEKKRKTILDFCYIIDNGRGVALQAFLDKNGLEQSNLGATKVNHTKGIYGVYGDPTKQYKGIASSSNANELSVSSIEKEDRLLAHLFFNQDAYSTYCKQYKEYWTWVEERNEERYKNTIAHGKNYDAKNMMHTLRLLLMAKEIAEVKKVKVWREDRDELLKVRSGEYSYQELLERAEVLYQQLPDLYAKSGLPEKSNKEALSAVAHQIRLAFYKQYSNC